MFNFRMRKQLPATDSPDWLLAINDQSEFRREDVLNGSVYYPASQLDGAVLKAYGGFAHSFVYVDPNVSRTEFIEQSSRVAGYDLIMQRELLAIDLCPNPLPNHPINPKLDGDPLALRRWGRGDPVKPFASWLVLQRRSRTDPAHGPLRLSIVFIAGEGVATYQALYNSNCLRPIAIVMKNHFGFAGNWTEFPRRGAIFERVVMNNSAGAPTYLFADNIYGYVPDPVDRNRYIWHHFHQMIKESAFLNIWRYSETTI